MDETRRKTCFLKGGRRWSTHPSLRAHIVKVEGVDATLIGPSYLSSSMGYRGQFWHPEVVKAMDRVLKACKSSKVAPGIAFGRNTEHCKEFIDKGYRFIAIGSDTGFMATGIDQVLKQLKG